MPSRVYVRVSGFTLVEVLVSIAVVSVVISLALPALAVARRRAASVKCLTQLRSLGESIGQYRLSNHDLLPYADSEVDIRVGLRDPIDAIAPFIDARAPYLDDAGFVRTGAPYLCSADREWGPRTGMTYEYFPWLEMLFARPETAQRLVTLSLDSEPRATIFAEPWGTHSNYSNRLFADGSASQYTDSAAPMQR